MSLDELSNVDRDLCIPPDVMLAGAYFYIASTKKSTMNTEMMKVNTLTQLFLFVNVKQNKKKQPKNIK